MNPEERRMYDDLSRRCSQLEQDLTRILARPAATFTPDDEQLCKLVDPLYNTMAGTATAKLCYRDASLVTPEQEIEITLSASQFFGFAYVDQFVWVRRHTGQNWRPMHLGHQLVIGKTDTSISAGGTGAVSIWTGHQDVVGSVDTTVNLTVRHEKLASGSIASGKWIYAAWRRNEWHFNGVAC